MLEAEYLLFVNDKTIDDRNRLNLYGIADRAYAPSFPVRIQGIKAHFKLVNKGKALIKTNLDIVLSFNLKGKEVGKADINVEDMTLEKGLGFAPTIELDQLVFSEPGDYKVKVIVEDKELIERTFTIRPESELTEV